MEDDLYVDEEIEKIFRPFDIQDEWNEVDVEKLYLIAVKSCGYSEAKENFEKFKEDFCGREETSN